MLGSIMPEPFAVPPTVKVPRAVCTVTACSFGNGSVVMMARAVSLPRPRASADTAARMPADTVSHRQADTDHTGGGDEHLVGAAAQARRDIGRHVARVRDAVLAGAGIRAAAVHHDGAHAPLGPLDVLARDEHRRRLRQVRREQRSRSGRTVRGEHGEVERRGRRLDAGVQRRRREAGRRGDTTRGRGNRGS